MGLFQAINRKGCCALFFLGISVGFSTSLSAQSTSSWVKRPLKKMWQDGLKEIEKITDSGEDSKSLWDRVQKKKKGCLKTKNPGGISSQPFHPHLVQAERYLKEKGRMKQFSQGFIQGMLSVKDNPVISKEQGKDFLKTLRSSRQTQMGKLAKGTVILAFATGDYISNLPSEKIPNEFEKIPFSWKGLSVKEKGVQAGRLMARMSREKPAVFR